MSQEHNASASKVEETSHKKESGARKAAQPDDALDTEILLKLLGGHVGEGDTPAARMLRGICDDLRILRCSMETDEVEPFYLAALSRILTRLEPALMIASTEHEIVARHAKRASLARAMVMAVAENPGRWRTPTLAAAVHLEIDMSKLLDELDAIQHAIDGSLAGEFERTHLANEVKP